MRRLGATDMSALPDEVRTLVLTGVYALYSVKGEPLFALVTDKGEFYLLTRDGEIAHHPKFKTIEGTPLDEVVTFSEAPSARLNRI